MAKSKRSKHMRAMRKLLREKLAKKDEIKRLASLKNDQLIPATVPVAEPSKTDEEMQVAGNMNGTSEYNSRTLKNKDGHYPPWLSGRQRKRLQAKQAVQKRSLKKKKKLSNTGKIVKRKTQQQKTAVNTSEIMLT